LTGQSATATSCTGPSWPCWCWGYSEGSFYYLGEHAGLIFAAQGSDHVSANGMCPAGYPCFNSFVYSFQMLIPGLDLREAAYWWPDATIAP
jgi:hypothetical protein